MNPIYDLTSPQQLIKLAQDIQVKIYWKSSFYLGESDTRTSYSHLWDIIEEHVEAGYTKMHVVYDTITFSK